MNTTIEPTPWIVPVRRCRRTGEHFEWPDGSTLASGRRADALPLEQLATSLKRAGVRRTRVALDAGSDAACRIHRSPSIEHDEGYRLTIKPVGVEILARTDAGAYYAIQTLRDMLVACGRQLPTCRIDDWPDFPRRAIYHDTARGKIPTVETVKGLVERLAHWKVNELQLYVENGFTFAGHPKIGRGFDGYTPADLHAIEANCRKHHVRFVGSLTSFGHMELILKEPEYQHLGELPGWNNFPGGTTLCPVDPGSIRLVREMYGEYLPLFEAEPFNACGDEPWELGKGRSKSRVEKVGEGRVYLEFMKQVLDICTDHGKQPNVWSDIVLHHPELLADWPSETVMLNWAYKPGHTRVKQTELIAEAGLPFMACSGTNAWCSHGSRLDWAIDNVREFSAVARKLGALGILHTDWGDGCHRNTLGASMLSFAHAAAHGWDGRAVDDKSFPRTFCRLHFGQDDDRLAESVEKLGSMHRVTGHPTGLYQSLRVNIINPRRKKLWRVDHGRRSPNEPFFEHDPDRLAEAIELAESLTKASAWPKPPRWAEDFDRLHLAEYRLAAMQDHVNARRTKLGLACQRGETVTAPQWRKLDRQLGELGERFDELWLARNRRSRLGENQTILNRARRECQKLAGK